MVDRSGGFGQVGCTGVADSKAPDAHGLDVELTYGQDRLCQQPGHDDDASPASVLPQAVVLDYGNITENGINQAIATLAQIMVSGP
jgi:hypothetical protein